MKINVKCNICSENQEPIEIKEIIKRVKELPKEEITYNSADYKSQINQSFRELNCVDATIKAKGNVYFIFDEDKLLYVGKSLNVQQRLRDHLIKCNKKTYSKIRDVRKYLEDNHLLKLSYCTIEVSEERFYGTVEGMIIKYIHEHKDEFFYNWNLRED